MEIIIIFVAFALGFLLGRISAGSKDKFHEAVSTPVIAPDAVVKHKQVTAPVPMKESEPTPVEAETGDPSLFNYEPCEYYGTKGIEITRYIGFNESKIVIPGQINGLPVISIAEEVFHKLHIRTVILPDTLLKIGALAFFKCAFLHEVKLPSGIKEIGAGAFHLSGLRKILLPEGLEKLGNGVFEGTQIAEISFPSTLTEIPNDCCCKCHCLTKVTISNGIRRVGERAFHLERDVLKRTPQDILPYIVFPASVEYIGNDALRDRYATEIAFKGMNTDFGYIHHNGGRQYTVYVLAGSVSQEKARSLDYTVRPLSAFPYK